MGESFNSNYLEGSIFQCRKKIMISQKEVFIKKIDKILILYIKYEKILKTYL